MRYKTVKIWLEADPHLGLKPKVSEEKVKVSKTKDGGESVIWECTDGDAEIEFKDESPFRSAKFFAPLGGFVGSGVPVKGEIGKGYKYSVNVTRPGDGRKYPLDPEVVVDNGT